MEYKPKHDMQSFSPNVTGYKPIKKNVVLINALKTVREEVPKRHSLAATMGIKLKK